MSSHSPKKLILFISQPYLMDYYEQVRDSLADLNDLCIEVLAPFDADCIHIRRCKPDALCDEQTDFFWSTAEMLMFSPPNCVRIATYHHAGYGEHQFILNRNVLAHADVLFCATFHPAGALCREDAYHGLVERPGFGLSVIPVGYPKLDRTIRVVQKACPDRSVIIGLSTVADNPYRIDSPLRSVIQALLERNVPVILRPFPQDIEGNQVIREVIAEFASCPLFSLSEGSYISAFARARAMIFFGRPDATTAYTYSFSTLRPCFFYSPENASADSLRDIGMATHDVLRLIHLACSIDFAEWHPRLVGTRAKALDYVGESDGRLREVFKALICGAPLENSTYYDLNAPLGSISEACDSLMHLVREVKSGLGNSETSYLLVDHLQGMVARLSPDRVERDAPVLVHYVDSLLADAPLQNQFRALHTLAPLQNLQPNLPCWVDLSCMAQRVLVGDVTMTQQQRARIRSAFG